jgi:hypothetical protein
MFEYEVYDNFLDYESFIKIQNAHIYSNFPWYMGPIVSEKYMKNNNLRKYEKENFQFSHVFYENNEIKSSFISNMNPILDKIKMYRLIRLKSNMQLGKKKIDEKLMHVDYEYDCKTAVYYLNTNNGYTLLENNEKIYSVENRLLVFNSEIKHSGVGCTDKPIRIVTNINFV